MSTLPCSSKRSLTVWQKRQVATTQPSVVCSPWSFRPLNPQVVTVESIAIVHRIAETEMKSTIERERLIAEVLAFVRAALQLPGIKRIALIYSLTTEKA